MEENKVQNPVGTWKKVTLGEILEYEQPYKYCVSSTEYNDESGTPVLTAGKSFLLGYTAETENVYTACPVIIFDDFTTDSKFVDFPFKVKSSAMKFLKAKKKEELSLKFIFGIIQALKISENGGDHKRRWISEFSKIEIHLPVFQEQQKISSVLSKVDETISQTEQLLAKYNRLRAGLMQDLLTKGIDENGNTRSEISNEFKDSPLGRIPMEWEVVNLSSVATITSGITLGKKNSGPDTVVLPYLRVANVQDGFLDLSEIKSIRVPVSYIDKYELKKGDVLMNEGGDFDKLGRGTVWNGEIAKCLHQNHVFKVRVNKQRLLPEYLAAYSSSPFGKSFFILSSKQSTNLASINSTQLKSFPVILPPLEEQMRIQKLHSKVNECLSRYERELSKLNHLKSGLMQDLLTGKKSVKNLIQEEIPQV